METKLQTRYLYIQLNYYSWLQGTSARAFHSSTTVRIWTHVQFGPDLLLADVPTGCSCVLPLPDQPRRPLTCSRKNLERASCYLKPLRVGEGERKAKAESSRGETALPPQLLRSLLLSPVYLRDLAPLSVFPAPARGGGLGRPRPPCPSPQPRTPPARSPGTPPARLAFGPAAAGGPCAAGGCRARRGGVR